MKVQILILHAVLEELKIQSKPCTIYIEDSPKQFHFCNSSI